MTTEKFNKIVEETLAETKAILIKKTKEYNLEADRLSIFKHAAGLTGGTPEQALLGFIAKQITSVYEMVNSKKTYSEEAWREKVSDCINYFILLKALLKDTGRSK